jgi:hypothetical protein
MNDTGMKQPDVVMSKRSKEEFLEWCRDRYPRRDRMGKSRMIDEVCVSYRLRDGKSNVDFPRKSLTFKGRTIQR